VIRIAAIAVSVKTLLRIILVLGCLFVAVFAFLLFIYRDRRPPIFHAIENGDTNAIGRYLALGSNVNVPVLSYPFGGNRNVPLLDIAVENGQLETVEFLLKNKADPNQTDYRGATPLQWAVGHIKNDVPMATRAKILKTLVESGADPNGKDSNQYGHTPVINAANFGEMEMVKLLLAAGADVSATNYEGMTALHFADNAEIARFLIDAGADRNAHAGGETPAETAIRLGNFGALTVLTNGPTTNH
jgi:ankyrin repeat protein